MDSEQYKETLAKELKTRPLSVVMLESLVLVFGDFTIVTGNALVLLTIYRNTRLRRPANLYIVSLAVTDFLMGVLAIPLIISAVVMGEWKLGRLGCWISRSLSFILAAASIFTMLLIAVNRYFKIVKPNKYSSVFSLKFIIVSIVLAWVLALAFPCIVPSQESRIEFDPGYLFCVTLVKTENMAAKSIVNSIWLVLPFCFISLLYYKIWIFVRQHNAHMNQSQVHLEELKLTKSLFVVVGSFLICFLPFNIISTLDSNFYYRFPRQLYFFCTVMLTTSSFINPIIYGAMNRGFRKEFLELFHRVVVKALKGQQMREKMVITRIMAVFTELHVV